MIDSHDRPLVAEALARALDPMSDNQPVRWGEGSNSRGSIVARGRAFIFEDQICRGFHAVIEKPANHSPYQGAACRQGLGDWRIISGLATDP
jgi:surface antigen